jgi:hypothetical protein
MGRPSTGAWTVYESLRIELPYLLQQGYIKKGCIIQGSLNWSNQHGTPTGSISFRSSYLGGADSFLQVSYTLTREGEKKDVCYKIYFHEQPSNLGKGHVLYFLCPQTGRKCRILYKAYGCEQFKSKQAYSHRLYYDCQQASRFNRYNDAYWRLDSHIKKLKAKGKGWKRNYKGQPTKAAQRYQRLWEKQNLMEKLRWHPDFVPKAVRGELAKWGLDSLW